MRGLGKAVIGAAVIVALGCFGGLVASANEAKFVNTKCGPFTSLHLKRRPCANDVCRCPGLTGQPCGPGFNPPGVQCSKNPGCDCNIVSGVTCNGEGVKAQCVTGGNAVACSGTP